MEETTITGKMLHELGARLAARRRKALNRLGGKVFRAMDDAYSRASTIPVRAILPSTTFDWLADVEAQTPTIRRELDALLQDHASLPRFQDISPEQKRISPGDDWRTFFFRGFGTDAVVAPLLCPETMRVLSGVPALQTAFFSILEPGTVIPSHCGVSRGLVRVHVPIMVPTRREACFMEIDGQRHSWAEGEAFVFDDTFRHAVRNDTSERRVVLLLDVERPMGWRGKLLLRSSLGLLGATHYVQDGLRRQAQWERDVGSQILARRRAKAGRAARPERRLV